MNNLLKKLGAGPLLLFFALPLLASLFFAISEIFVVRGWTLLFSHPQLWPAVELSLLCGLASSVLSVAMATLIVTGLYKSLILAPLTSSMLAVPHVAMAIGISFLIMPSGIIARAIAVVTQGQMSPDWITTHDPHGLALVGVLVLKETPFLIWSFASNLNREDVRRHFAGQRSAALSLGHSMASIWLRIFLPQLLPKMTWAILIVFVYAATVVDVALVIGPTQPPPLSLIVWADINDAQISSNMRGAAGAWFLTGMVGLTAMALWGLLKLMLSRRGWLTVGPHTRDTVRPFVARVSSVSFCGLAVVYLITTFALLMLSFATLWPFPNLWPETLSFSAWVRVVQNPAAIVTSLVLAITTTATALVIAVSWLESQPQSRDRVILILGAVALAVPAILFSLGQYRAFLHIGLTGTALGVFIAHLVPVTAYMFFILVGPYRSFDPRWKSSAYGLLSNFPRFFWHIKLPLLKAPLLGASAVGFAVSFGQYVPAQLIASGRYSTLPMEAVTLTSGTNRPLTAAFGLLLMVPPLLAFLGATYFGRPRWSDV